MATINHQLKLRDNIIKAYREYDSGVIKRDEKSLKEFLDLLNEMWELFEKNHDELLGNSTIDVNDAYFTKDTHGGLKVAVDNLKQRITARLNRQENGNGSTENNTDDNSENERAKQSIDLLANSGLELQDNREVLELSKLKALYNTKIEILRVTMEKTQLEQNTGAIYLQQKIKSLEAQWRSLTALADEILKVENSETVLRKIMDAQEEFDAGLTTIQEKARNIEQVKLPPMNIPTFDGTFGAWRNFRDSFETAVHLNTEISNVQKMQHLKAHTKGEANKIIRHLTITADNYETAWDILKSRFDHERKLVRTYYETARNTQKIENATAKALRELHDIFIESLSSMSNMGFQSDEHWVVNFIIDKLDDTTLRAFERAQKEPRKFPTLDGLLKFIDERADSLEAFKVSNESSAKNDNGAKYRNENEERKEKKCYECKGGHGLFRCDKFKTYDINKRWETIKKYKLCSICFGKHFFKDCKSKYRCEKCQGQHSQLLHNEAKQKAKEKTTVSANTTRSDRNEVFLGTALVKCKTKQGDYVILRALIDEGSQGTFITERAAQLLQLKKEKISASVDGFGDKQTEIIKSMMKIEAAPMHESKFCIHMNALITKKITKILPGMEIPIDKYTHLKNIQLADPEYNKPAPIDMQIGSDYWGQFALEGIIKAGPEVPYAHQSELGWVVLGKTAKKSTKILNMISNVEIEETLKQFWKVESIDLDPRAIDEDECETFFKENHTRDESGGFIVAIPFKSSIKQLGKSRNLAVAQMLQLEKKFRLNPEYKERYVACMNEYIELGHMIPVKTTEEQMAFKMGDEIQYNTAYLPHHAVIKESSTTTKLRVVFNASRKTSTGISLNDAMMVGPNRQGDIISIAIRWRKYLIVFAGDVRQMYRQIWVRLQDAEYQRIVWRESEDEPIGDYKLTTVTFGTASAPYLATRTLHQTAVEAEKEHPRAAEIVKDDTYMDDSCGGTWATKEAICLQREMKQILAEAGFDLRKWISNNLEFLMNIPKEDRELQPEEFYTRNDLKILGLPWNNADDYFTYKYEIADDEPTISKRKFLAVTAALFDPIGWLSPITVKIKIMYQQIWADGIDWDEPISGEVQNEWEEFKKQAHLINQIKIPRWIGLDSNQREIQLHGFSDASMKGIAACIYTRIMDKNGIVKVTLLIAKNRVAPRDKKGRGEITLPRLELCGAHLLALLFQKAISALKCENVRNFAWSDSMISIAWIKNNPGKWKTFVAERVRKIQQAIGSECWRYVPTKENPSDLASRGLFPAELMENNLWWNGPEWLCKPEEDWPKQPTQFGTVQEMHTSRMVNTTMVSIDFFGKFVSWQTLQKTMALCIRFATNCKQKEKNTQNVSVLEMRTATIRIIQNTQEHYFKEELQQLRSRKNVASTSCMANLNPFLDENGVIRVGGRLQNATMSYAQKHPIILPKTAHISRLIIDDAHNMTIHGGENSTMAFIRCKFWIIGSGVLVKNRLKSCIRCARVRATCMKHMMANLPTPRVNITIPFEHTGVDYAGPFNIRTSKGRGHKTYKGYISLFICLATKAMHLEAVSDLKSTGFIAAFKRFVSRRGTPAHMYSDNGTNFCAANKFLQIQNKEEHKKINDDLAREMTKRGIRWHFNPPAAPHFGGLWEAGVKSVKTNLVKTQIESFTFEEFTTLLYQIEACLNSRPICPMSNDVNDLRILTPAHFLVGKSLVAPPDESDLFDEVNDLTRWQLVQRRHREFWQQWKQEYLTRMQQRPKWLRKGKNLEVGDLVMINEPNTPPTRWAMGRVKEIHPGTDGIVRVATVRTPEGICKRPVVKLCLLANQTSNDSDQLTGKGDALNDVAEQSNCLKGTSSDLPAVQNSVDDIPAEQNSANDISAVQGNGCNEPVLQREVNKPGLNKRKKRTPRKKHLTAIDNTQNRGNRTGYNLRSFVVAMIMMFLLSTVAGNPIENTKPYSVERFEDQPGIYFEEMGYARLMNDNWHLVVYYKLEQYFWQIQTLDKLEKQMEYICNQTMRTNFTDDAGSCMNILGQLSTHLSEIRGKNRIFHMSNPENDLKIRRRRGLIDGIGMVANEVFGVLDSRFAERYENDIKTAEKDRDHMIRLIQNQTSIFDATANLMKKSQRETEKQFHQLEIVLGKIDDAWNETNRELSESRRMQAFTQLALQVTIILERYEHLQDTLLDLVTDTHQGHVNPLIIPPELLREQVILIQANLPSDVKLPSGNQQIDLLRLYSAMSVKTGLRENMLIFDVRLPLINNIEFQIFKMYPLPVEHGNEMMAIRPSTEYLLINLNRDLYQGLTESDFGKCNLEHNMYYCDHRNILLKPESGRHLCEIKLLLHQSLGNTDCNYVRQSKADFWMQLSQRNKWIFSMSTPKTVVIICNNQPFHQELTGEGILSVTQRCSIQTPDLQIQSGIGIKTTLNRSFLPMVNITDRLMTNNLRESKFPKISNLQTTNHIEEIEELQKKMGQLDMQVEGANIHQVHHYVSIYVLMAIFAMVGAFKIYRKMRPKPKKETVIINLPREPSVRMEMEDNDNNNENN